jgi:hypothetical protein
MENFNFYAYIRHGERADMIKSTDKNNFVIDREDENPVDVPLTKEGMLQAQRTG